MFREIEKKVDFGSHELTLKTGKIARQADAAITAQMGDTIVLATVCVSDLPHAGSSFFPLTVHYREMLFSAGKIPGGFIKREGKASDYETLVSRLIDRSIRPLFPENFYHEVQIICTVLSYDPAHSPDIIAMIASSAAVAISKSPTSDIIAAAKIGIIDDEFVLNPSNAQIKESKLDIIVSGTKSSIMMVESEACEISERKILDAIKFAHEQFQPVLQAIEELVQECGKAKLCVVPKDDTLLDRILGSYNDRIKKCFALKGKAERNQAFNDFKTELTATYADSYDALAVHLALEEAKYTVLRLSILNDKIRIDGRGLKEIRSIACETDWLPRVHGSSLFTRGETQAIVTTTLGSSSDEQIIDGLDKSSKESFILHYIFPPYSVGETSPFKAPGRREVGHGKLAWRALSPVMPSKAEFPYMIRVVSEITESNGSSSMATVCGASLSLMDAGVPIRSHVSGIAMGLIKEGEKYAVLSDILGDEDFLGDMDFKVAGTSNGVTALQMDIKINGINIEILEAALSQAHEGRVHILNIMQNSINTHNTVLSHYAPRIISMKINRESIKDLIGPGGKTIKEICESTGSKIDIEESGILQIAASGVENLELAINRIKMVTEGPEIGSIVTGRITKIVDFGAFIALDYIREEGLIHISEISNDRVNNVEDHLKVGDIVNVKIIGSDNRGRMKFSMKAANNS